MGQDHAHAEGQAARRLGFAFGLNFAFTVIELIGAYFTNSTAIAADALHDLGDSLSLAFAWGVQGVASRRASGAYSYGLRRLSLVGALVNGVVLLVGGGLVLAYCVPRLAEPVQPEAHGMLALALFGVLVNGVAALRIRKGTTLNERVAALHLLEDVLGWVAVLIVSVVMLFADVPILDPLLSLLVTLWVGYNAARNVKKTVDLFLQAVPEDVDVQGLREVALSQTGVRDLRHVHVWSLEGERHVLTGHLEVEPATLEEAVALRERVSAALREAGIEHATLQLELPDAAAPQDSPELRQDPASE